MGTMHTLTRRVRALQFCRERAGLPPCFPAYLSPLSPSIFLSLLSPYQLSPYSPCNEVRSLMNKFPSAGSSLPTLTLTTSNVLFKTIFKSRDCYCFAIFIRSSSSLSPHMYRYMRKYMCLFSASHFKVN